MDSAKKPETLTRNIHVVKREKNKQMDEKVIQEGWKEIENDKEAGEGGGKEEKWEENRDSDNYPSHGQEGQNQQTIAKNNSRAKTRNGKGE